MTNPQGSQLVRSIALPLHLDKAVEAMARKQGVNVSEWFRRLITREAAKEARTNDLPQLPPRHRRRNHLDRRGWSRNLSGVLGGGMQPLLVGDGGATRPTRVD